VQLVQQNGVRLAFCFDRIDGPCASRTQANYLACHWPLFGSRRTCTRPFFGFPGQGMIVYGIIRHKLLADFCPLPMDLHKIHLCSLSASSSSSTGV
jgi:hypothetical protein